MSDIFNRVLFFYVAIAGCLRLYLRVNDVIILGCCHFG